MHTHFKPRCIPKPLVSFGVDSYGLRPQSSSMHKRTPRAHKGMRGHSGFRGGGNDLQAQRQPLEADGGVFKDCCLVVPTELHEP